MFANLRTLFLFLTQKKAPLPRLISSEARVVSTTHGTCPCEFTKVLKITPKELIITFGVIDVTHRGKNYTIGTDPFVYSKRCLVPR